VISTQISNHPTSNSSQHIQLIPSHPGYKPQLWIHLQMMNLPAYSITPPTHHYTDFHQIDCSGNSQPHWYNHATNWTGSNPFTTQNYPVQKWFSSCWSYPWSKVAWTAQQNASPLIDTDPFWWSLWGNTIANQAAAPETGHPNAELFGIHPTMPKQPITTCSFTSQTPHLLWDTHVSKFSAIFSLFTVFQQYLVAPGITEFDAHTCST